MQRLLRYVPALALLLGIGGAHAAYPDRPVTLIVPYAAGGPMDKLARQLASQASTLLGQPVVIQNQAGAGGNIGVASAKRAAPDGYTVLLDHVHMATAPSLYRHLAFEPETDFEPLGIVAESPLVLIGRPEVPTGGIGELLRWMARQPQVTLANAGVGSASHLCGLLLQSTLKIRMTTVPYTGTGPAMIDLMGGQVDLMCDLTANALPQIEAGKVRPIAVTVREPLSGTVLAAVPSMERLGIAEAPLTIWYGLYVPRSTPAPIMQTLASAIRTVAGTAAFRKQQVDAGLRAVADDRLSPAGHRGYLRDETRRWAGPIQAAGAYAD
jgi:tripartite-type tricarboxylate transporter receptor subunit TctC